MQETSVPFSSAKAWPLDKEGKEVFPFWNVEYIYFECWSDETNKTKGIKGDFGGIFRWDCETLADEIKLLKGAIEDKWGNGSTEKFGKSAQGMLEDTERLQEIMAKLQELFDKTIRVR